MLSNSCADARGYHFRFLPRAAYRWDYNPNMPIRNITVNPFS